MNDDTCPLTKVIELVVAAVEQYQSSLAVGENPLPPLVNAKFEFQSIASKTTGFSLNLFIFKFGSSHENDVMNDVYFTYLPTSSPISGQTPSPSDIAASQELAKVIESAALSVSNNPGFLNLAFDDLQVKIQYGVTWSVDAAANWTNSFVTAGLSGNAKKNTLQAITLEFGKAQPAPERKEK